MGLFSRSKNSNKPDEASTSQYQQQQQQQQQQPRQRVGLDNPVYTNNNNNNLTSSTRRPPVQDVASVIGFECAAASFDFSYILALCDYISLSASESTKAARALRKELKYAVPDAQERAIRLTGIMCKNSDLRFRQQIASKKFLGELADLVNSKKTNSNVVAMILRVLSPLAFEYQYDRDLLPITTLYNKLKSIDDPLNGLPLAEDDTLFTPTTITPRASRVQYQTEMPTREEQLKWLQRKANSAKGNAAMLSEGLAFAENGDLEGNEIVAEFYAKCFESQEIITSNLDWCAVEAERSRSQLPISLPIVTNESPPLDLLSISPTPPPTTTHYKSHNPFAPIIEASIPQYPSPPITQAPVITTKTTQQEPTEEEMTYAMLLSAHSDITEVLHLHDTILSNAKEAKELKKIQERSKEEMRTDSQGNWLELSPPTSPISESGTGVGVGGGSGSYNNGNSTASGGNGNGNGNGNRQSLSSSNPYANYQTSSSPPQAPNNNDGGYMMDEPEMTGGTGSGAGGGGSTWEPLTPSKPSFSPPSSSKFGNLGGNSNSGEGEYLEEPSELEVKEEEARRRLGPSDKALGKLRKVSEREDRSEVDQQAALEDALRAKYRE